MKVHFLRHAQSIFNANLTSEKDCDLTEKGKLQASQVEGEYDVVFCSVMKRTQETLKLSKIKYGCLISTDLCREKRVDICDYLPYEDETVKETDEALEQRIKTFLYFLKSQASPYQSVLVVSHGDFIHTLGKKSQPYPQNAEIQVHEV
jgi:broad specificity phosphatase PhoE